jgi:hypothetical protein
VFSKEFAHVLPFYHFPEVDKYFDELLLFLEALEEFLLRKS